MQNSSQKGNPACFSCPAYDEGCAVAFFRQVATVENNYLNAYLAWQEAASAGFTGEHCANNFSRDTLLGDLDLCRNCPAALWGKDSNDIFFDCIVVALRGLIFANFHFTNIDSLRADYQVLEKELINQGFCGSGCTGGFLKES